LTFLLKRSIFFSAHERRRVFMAMKEAKVRDIMRGKKEEVVIRFEDTLSNLAKLPCSCRYDPVLSRKSGNHAMVVRKIERKNADGSWSPYPSVTFLDGVSNENQLVTVAFIKKLGEEGYDIMQSTDGIPDYKLLTTAKEAGIFTEFIDHS